MRLMDQGKATRMTMGRLIGALTELGPPPFNKWCGRANCADDDESRRPPEQPAPASGADKP